MYDFVMLQCMLPAYYGIYKINIIISTGEKNYNSEISKNHVFIMYVYCRLVLYQHTRYNDF